MQNIEINFNKYFKMFNIFSISLILISIVLAKLSNEKNKKLNNPKGNDSPSNNHSI